PTSSCSRSTTPAITHPFLPITVEAFSLLGLRPGAILGFGLMLVKAKAGHCRSAGQWLLALSGGAVCSHVTGLPTSAQLGEPVAGIR
ncbi:MAG: hypothetical protein ACYTFZ_06455, partial [Planctomycetota bacterium]